MLSDERRRAVQSVLGKTLTAVVVAEGPRSPASMVHLVFDDGTSYELYAHGSIEFTKHAGENTAPERLAQIVASAFAGYEVEVVTDPEARDRK